MKAAVVHLFLLLLAIIFLGIESRTSEATMESDLSGQLSKRSVMSRFRRMDCCRYNQVLNCCTFLWDWNEGV
uniref:Conotoxin n=1 Tax=Haemonchus contortus TaxID=6289 RepID=A0A7I4YAJ3_HAECO|nr:unnamed protein product [Haemonchus contortus]